MDSFELTQAILGQEKGQEFHLMGDGRITTESRDCAFDESVNLAFADAVNESKCCGRLPENGQRISEFTPELRRSFAEAMQRKHKNIPSMQEAFLPFEVNVLARLYKTTAEEK